MDNSFNLGLVHGAFYGITPLTPWFLAIRHYVFAGQNKGLLTFAGIFLGQILLLFITFFGGTELLWLWYYLEPLFMSIGVGALINIIYRSWLRPRRFPQALINRKEGFKYLGLGVAYAVCNPSGVRFNEYILESFPENPTAYLGAFVLVYSITAALVVYMLCFSVPAQKCFGNWSFQSMQTNQPVSSTYFLLRVRAVRILSILLILYLSLYAYPLMDQTGGVFYVDMLLGGTPAKRISPMRDFFWIESNEERDETLDEKPTKPGKLFKLQSACDQNQDNRIEPEADEDFGLWSTAFKYNDANERLEREDLSDREKDKELSLLNKNELSKNETGAWFEESKLRMQYKPQFEWDEKNHANPLWFKMLATVRTEMDTLLKEGGQANLTRPHMPFTPIHDNDYEWDPVAIAKTDEVTEDDVDMLAELRAEIKDKKDLVYPPDVDIFYEDYDTTHRGGEYMEVGPIKLQDLPKEVYFPWDYPLIHAPNVQDLTQLGTLAEKETVVNTKNVVQNKNVWFLDPIALNMRFLSNDPAPATDPGWTSGILIKKHVLQKGKTTPADTVDLRAANVTRRWWLGDELATAADAETSSQPPHVVITGKVSPSGSKRP
jgi:hypothetical protein